MRSHTSSAAEWSNRMVKWIKPNLPVSPGLTAVIPTVPSWKTSGPLLLNGSLGSIRTTMTWITKSSLSVCTLHFPLYYITLYITNDVWIHSDDQIDKQIPLNAKSIFDTTAVLDRLGALEKTEEDPVSIYLVLEQNSLETDLSFSSSSSSGSIKTVT